MVGIPSFRHGRHRSRRTREMLERAVAPQPAVLLQPLESRTLLAVTLAGGETVVDAGNGINPAVAMNDAGEYVVAWNEINNTNEVHVRRYDASGTPRGTSFKAPFTSDLGGAVFPAVAMDDAGDFVVVAGRDEVYAQRYDATGTAQGEPVRVNTQTERQQWFPDVAMDADGDFVVAWVSNLQDGDGYGIYAQRFDAAGDKGGPEFLVNETTAGNQQAPQVAMDDDSDFTVVWTSLDAEPGSGHLVVARRFDAAGTPLGGEITINPSNPGAGYAPDIDVNASDDGVITWTALEAGFEYVYVRTLSSGGVLGDAVPVHPTNAHNMSSVAIDDAGRFLVTWTRKEDPEDPDPNAEPVDENVYVQAYTAAGVPDGPLFRANTYAPKPQFESVVAADAAGNAVVAFISFRQEAPGGGIYSQRYKHVFGGTPEGVITGAVWRDADRNGVREAGEAGASDVEVNLFNDAGAIAGTTVTAADGSYRFDGLSADVSYVVQVVPPPGTVLTDADRGEDDAVDSDFIAASGRTPPYLVPPRGTLDFDAGLVAESTVSGVVFHDRDGDATRDPAAEEPLPGWTVFLDADGDGQRGPDERSAVTGDDGRYHFAQLRPGTTRIGLVGQRYWTTTPGGGVRVVDLGPGQSLDDADFANRSGIPTAQVLPQGPPVKVASDPLLGTNMSVAIDWAGRQIVVWQHFNGVDDDVLIQRYDADGQPLGESYPAHTFMPAHQSYPSVAALPNGGFVVAFSGYTYVDENSASHDPEVPGVWLQRFDANGAAVGAVERVDNVTDWGDWLPTIAVHAETGRFAVAWSSLGALPTGPTGNEPTLAMLRWYNADGTPDGAPIPFSSGVSQYQGDVDMGFAGDGTLSVIAEGDAIFFRRFGPDRQPLGPEQPLAVPGYEASAAVAPSGDFLVATYSERNGQSIMQVFARRFAPDGTPVGEEFVITPRDPARSDYSPVVAAHADEYTLAWRRQTPGESTVFVQRYSLAGVKLGDEFPVHDAAFDAQMPVIAGDGNGGFAVGFGAILIPEFTYGVVARRYVVADNQAPTAVADAPDRAFPFGGGAQAVDLNELFDDDQGDGALYFTLAGNSNPAFLIDAQFTPDGLLELTPTSHLPGSSTLTVRATDPGGRSANITFTFIQKPEIVLSGDAMYGLDGYVPLDLIQLSGNARLYLSQHLMVSFKTKALAMADNAVLDIPSYGLIIEATPGTRDAVLAEVHDLLGSARNSAGGRWTGPGITSSYLLSDDVPPNTTLAAIVNPGHLTDANGEALGPDAMVITYTYNGDANLDGRVNADDYFRIDQGFLAQPSDPHYAQGDFNYDGKVNADDYFLIDQAFLGQGAAAATAAATAAPTPAARSAATPATVSRAADGSHGARKRRAARDRVVRALFA